MSLNQMCGNENDEKKYEFTVLLICQQIKI